MSEKIVQTAGRDQLGEFAPMFAHLNDDVLFGEVWNEEAIDLNLLRKQLLQLKRILQNRVRMFLWFIFQPPAPQRVLRKR